MRTRRLEGHYRGVKHDVNGRRQTSKITFDSEFFSSNPQIKHTKVK